MMNPSLHRALTLACTSFLAAFCIPAPGQWIAFNDHAAGDGTHSNATRYHILNQEDGTNGPLKNVFTGDALPVSLAISRSGLMVSEGAGAALSPTTPLHGIFHGYVDFAGSPAPNVGFLAGGQVTYTLAGLDSTKRYAIHAGAVRGGPDDFDNRWTLCGLSGVDSFTSEHSAGVLTSAEVPALAEHQAALHTGVNHTADTGDMVGWIDIDPGADGTIQIVCGKYAGEVPGGSSAGILGYALTGLSLREYVFDGPPSIQLQPANQTVGTGQSATFTVLAVGPSLEYQWFRNGDMIADATGPSYTLSSASLPDTGSRFSVTVSNGFGQETSDEAVLLVNAPAWTPISFDHVWRYDDNGANLGTAWHAIDFDDTPWDSGPGALGFETASLEEPIRTPVANHNGITYYFRTTFAVTNGLREHTFRVRHQIDDGAVFYLNGAEWFRVNMAAEAFDWLTPAAGTIGEAVVTVMDLPVEMLRLGTNWLAVEVHQATSSSSDLVMGLSVEATPVPPTPLTITHQPADSMVNEYQPATFAVGVEGIGAHYQWLKDGDPIGGAQDPELTLAQARLADAGSYTVVVSNVWSYLVSEPAVLTVAEAVPVQITNQPTNQTTFIAEPVMFTVDVEGDTPHLYQWFRDGSPLTSATNATLSLSKPHLPDTGVYSIQVSNNFSAATSDPFALEVLRHPRGEPGSLHLDFVADVEPAGVLSRTIARQRDGRILVSAAFDSINGVAQPNLARLSQDGLVDETFRPQIDGLAYAMEVQPDGKILIGGQISSIDGVPRIHLGRFHPDGNLDLDFNPKPSAPSAVWDVTVQRDGKIIAVGGTDSGEFYRYHPDGTVDISDINEEGGAEQAPFYYAVDVQPDGGILVGGRFREFHGLEYAHLVRLGSDGSLDESFLSGTNAPDGYVHAIRVHRNKIYISGIFTSVAGAVRSGIARLHMDGSIDPTFNPPLLSNTTIRPAVINFLIQPGGRILIVGWFNSADGMPMGCVARLHPNGSLDTSFQVAIGANERIYDAVMDLNGDIYLAGLFTEFNGEPRHGIAKIYGGPEPILDFQRNEDVSLEILWPGDREDLMLESADGVSGQEWTQVTEMTNRVHDLNMTTIDATPPLRVFRLRIP